MRSLGGTIRTALALVVVLSILLAPAAGRAQSPRFKIKQTGFRVLYIAPIFIAQEKGFFAQNGVDFSFQEINSGALGPATVVSGDAQVSDLDPLTIAQVQAQGKQLILFYNLVTRVTLDLIVRNDVIRKTGVSRFSSLPRRYAVLKGLNIGITAPGAPTDVFARYFLIKAGLNPDRDANLVQVGGLAGLAAALRSGRIDAFLLSPPLPQSLEQEGVGQIIIRNTAGDVPEFSNTTYDGIFTSVAYAKQNGPALIAFSKSVTQATAWIRANKAEALQILGQKYFPDTPAASLSIGLDAIMPAITTDGRFTQAGVQRYLDIFKTIGQPATASSAEGVLWTNSYVK
jgi:ABC-type nitrate/sulfonate/bicarbonate transport system substrate-binding protein